MYEVILILGYHVYFIILPLALGNLLNTSLHKRDKTDVAEINHQRQLHTKLCQPHLSSCRGKPLGRPALPLALGSLDLLPSFLVDADDVVVGKDLAIDHGLFGEGLSLLELGPHPGFLFGPLLLSRLPDWRKRC